MADIKSIKINGNLIVDKNVTINGIKPTTELYVKIGTDGLLKTGTIEKITSINGLSGGTLTSPLTITGGDQASAPKIILDQSNKGQITDSSTSTIFGFMSSETLTIGSGSYITSIRGSSNSKIGDKKFSDLAVKSDIDVTAAGNNTFAGTNKFLNDTYFGDDGHSLKISAGGNITAGKNTPDSLEISFLNSTIKFRDVTHQSAGTIVQADSSVGSGSADVTLTLPKKTGSLALTSDCTTTIIKTYDSGGSYSFTAEEMTQITNNFDKTIICIRYNFTLSYDYYLYPQYNAIGGPMKIFASSGIPTNTGPFNVGNALKLAITADDNGTGTGALTLVAAGDVSSTAENTFTKNNIFREQITVQSATSTNSYCYIRPTGVLTFDATTMPVGSSNLSGKNLKIMNNSGGIATYYADKIGYGFIANTEAYTLKFPYYDSSLPAQAIATTTDLVRSVDPSYMSIVYKGINFNFSKFKGGTANKTVNINWGDGNRTSVTAANTVPTHQYVTDLQSGVEDMYLITIEPTSNFCTTLPASSFEGTSTSTPGIYEFKANTGITTIGEKAFFYCENLRNVELASATTIGDYAFAYCNNLTEINLPAATNIGSYAFRNCQRLKNVIIPHANTLSTGAFENCSTLEKIILCYCLKSIPDNCFYGCNCLREVSIPEGVVGIGNNAFEFNSSLNEIIIPKTVVGIGNNAFNYTTLKKIIIKNSTAIIPYTTNMLYSEIEQIVVPYSLLSQYKAATGWSAFASKIVADITSDDISSLFTYSGNTLTINI